MMSKIKHFSESQSLKFLHSKRLFMQQSHLDGKTSRGSYPAFLTKRRSRSTETLPSLGLTLVSMAAVKGQCVVRVPVYIRINYSLNKKQFT